LKSQGFTQVLLKGEANAPTMERSKQFVAENFERFLVGMILIAALGGTYFIQEPSVVLNFYYLPVLVASYFLGRRTGMLAAAFSILSVILFCALLFPDRFFPTRSQWQIVTQLASWGGFLILASITVGTLYELNEKKLQDLRNAYVGILEILSKYLESTDR
jgi:hypothetical protein